MKTDKLRESSNIEDRRGQTDSLPSSYDSKRTSSMVGNLLMNFLFSRLNWKFKVIIAIALLITGGGLNNLFGSSSNYSPYQSNQVSTQQNTVSDQDAKFVSKVLTSTEEFWTEEFARRGLTYQPPTLVFYEEKIQTACGLGQAAAGPFYCSGDQKIYLDMSFYAQLTTEYQAKGDFAMAYVIAHEVGHHVQNELGTLEEYTRAKHGMSEKEANTLTVRLELQADYYAGAWAKYVDGQGLLDVGDIEEAMNAAHAVGDDTLQRKAYGHVVPDSFTHGTSEQRKTWFDRGYQYGDLTHGDTFNTSI